MSSEGKDEHGTRNVAPVITRDGTVYPVPPANTTLFSSPGTINRIYATADVLALGAEEEYDDVGCLYSRALSSKGSTIVERRIGWTVD